MTSTWARTRRGRTRRRCAPGRAGSAISGSASTSERKSSSSSQARSAWRLDEAVGLVAARAPTRRARRSTRWLKTRPWEASRFRRMRSAFDDEPVDEPREAVEHVVEREEGVGDDDPLGARVRDVALVPEGDVLERDERGRRGRRARGRRSARPRPGSSCAASPRSPSGRGRTARRPRRTSVRARWRISVAKRSSDEATIGEGRSSARRGGRAGSPGSRPARARGRAARRRAARPRGRRPRRHRPCPRACRPACPRVRAAQPRSVAVELERPAGELRAERDRLGVHAVRPADHRRARGAPRRGGRPPRAPGRARRGGAPRPRAPGARAPCRARPTTSGRSGASAPGGPTCSATASTKAATSCCVRSSISATRCGRGRHGAGAQLLCASSRGRRRAPPRRPSPPARPRASGRASTRPTRARSWPDGSSEGSQGHSTGGACRRSDRQLPGFGNRFRMKPCAAVTRCVGALRRPRSPQYVSYWGFLRPLHRTRPSRPGDETSF